MLYGDKVTGEQAPVIIRFSFLGYRDIDDQAEQFVECPFEPVAEVMTSREDVIAQNHVRASRVAEQLDRLIAKGGKDECEDVVGALDRVCGGSVSSPNTWGWSTRACAKFCILICDAPCHGSVCHPSDVDQPLGMITRVEVPVITLVPL